MEKTAVIGLIIAGLFIFALGGGLGIIYQQSQITPQTQTAVNKTIAPSTPVSAVEKTLSSKAFFTSASGVVTNISGNTITLSSNGQLVTLQIANNSKVYSIVQTPASGSKPESVKSVTGTIGLIKVGDTINAAVDISQNGQVEISSVSIATQIAPSKNNSNAF